MRRSEACLLALLCMGALAWAGDVPEIWTARLMQWRALPPPTRIELTSRIESWDALSPAERTERRARYAAWRALDEAQRMRLRGAAQTFSHLPEAEQQRLREVFATQDRTQQRAWGLGPELGADWMRLQPLFAYVPGDQRAPMLQLLRQTDASQREDLAALAQQIPPQSRDAFRRELLAVPAAQRADWLHRRRSQ